jgi:predicted lipid carrier protein YhbT
MLEALPRDADLYMVKRDLMICGDAEAVRALKNCVAHVAVGR